MTLSETEKPKLRLIDAQPIEYEGASYLLLRDPLILSEKTLLVPQPYIPILSLCDGTRTVATLRAALALRFGLFLTNERIQEFISALDDALLLENDHSKQARKQASKSFRAAPYREPASAGLSYPEKPKELSKALQNYLDGLNGKAQSVNGTVRGVVSPHIDYDRGGPVYAQVWSAASQAAREADLAIIFGTDHFSEGYPFSLTQQNYATPFGVLPTAHQVVDELAQVIGPDMAFAGELHHRKEHSIELAAVWMHHMRAGKPLELIPILTGSIGTTTHPGAVDVEAVLAVLQKAMRGRNAIVVAAGDLAHVGPAFGGDPVDPGKLIQLKEADDELIQAMCSGDAEAFSGAIERVEDANNVCGVAPIYLTLRLLAPLKGSPSGYSVCAADDNQTSVVTICGVTLQ